MLIKLISNAKDVGAEETRLIQLRIDSYTKNITCKLSHLNLKLKRIEFGFESTETISFKHESRGKRHFRKVVITMTKIFPRLESNDFLKEKKTIDKTNTPPTPLDPLETRFQFARWD